jgi:hypothetical protein
VTDIVERLRRWGSVMCVEGADEIERLRLGRETMGNLWAREKEARHEREAEIERLREFVSWVDAWVSNPVRAYSVSALDGLFGMTRDRIAALTTGRGDV